MKEKFLQAFVLCFTLLLAALSLWSLLDYWHFVIAPSFINEALPFLTILFCCVITYQLNKS